MFLSRNTSHGVNMLLHGFDPDIFLLFGIDMACDKVIMAPIISEEPSYGDNELKKPLYQAQWDRCDQHN
jgi:hypothetical protein